MNQEGANSSLKEMKVWLARQTEIPAVQTVGEERQPLLASMPAQAVGTSAATPGYPELCKGGTSRRTTLDSHHQEDWGDQG